MAKKNEITNVRVEVQIEPKFYGSEPTLEDAMRVIEAIRRHVDGVASATIAKDSRDYCTHCNSTWEVAADGEPLCCNKAVAEFNQERHGVGIL